MTAKRMEGAPVAQALRERIAEMTAQLTNQGVAPKLAMLRCGAKGPDLAYERGAKKSMEMCGILAQTTELAEDVSSEEAVAALTALSADPSVHGILVFQPLPQQVSLEAMREAMNPQKDVDCLRPFVPGDFNNQNALLPCTPGAVMEMLDYYEVALKGKDVTVIGASDVVGKPLALMLLDRWATPTVCHIFTKDTKAHCKQADIVIAAAGVPGLVVPEQIKEDAVVVDVGINFVDGKMCGDVAPDCAAKASLLSPVPGGVGSVTNTKLAENVVKAARNQIRKKK